MDTEHEPSDQAGRPGTADRLWTLDDVAAFLAVSRRTVQRLARQPGFPPRLVLGHQLHRWDPTAVRAWAATRAEPTGRGAFDALS